MANFNPLSGNNTPPVPVEDYRRIELKNDFRLPSPEDCEQLLASIKKGWGMPSIDLPGSILTTDLMLSASRIEAYITRQHDDGPVIVGTANNAVWVTWRSSYEDDKERDFVFCFWAEQWKGRKGLLTVVKNRLKELLEAGKDVMLEGVRSVRNKYSLSKSELGEICGVSPRTVDGWEQRLRSPSRSAMMLLAAWIEKQEGSQS